MVLITLHPHKVLDVYHAIVAVLKLEIYFDRISNEIFINDGVEVMSSLFYLENTKKYIWSNKPVKGLIKEIKL